ncbi:MAG: peptidase M15A [Mesorhizobium sp. 65-26]|nr:MAG: peptidase M15A [Mesorhizobium sp. SCN 65-12]OJX70625.1 MAG: peptidase M15A [Mesorhizobium sp. 65-26]
MKSAGSRLAKGESHAIVAALFSVLLASCTSTSDPALQVGMPGYNVSSAESSAAPQQPAVVNSAASTIPQQQAVAVTETADFPLPEQVAYVPVPKPENAFPVNVPAGADAIAGHTPQTLEQPAQTAQETEAVAAKIAAADASVTTSKPAASAAITPAPSNEVYVTAGEMPSREPAPKKGFLASLFGGPSNAAAPKPIISTRSGEQPAVAQAKMVPTPAPKPIVTLASTEPAQKPVQLASVGGDSSNFSSDALPGVRQTALFEIKRKSGLDDESDVDLHEDEGPGSYQVASAAGMARLAPNGLLKQNESVDVACLKPSLVRVLKTIEGHYGKKMIVTSGYRDPARNRRANGARNSLHMYCAAADIVVPGVSKWELASYLRSMPGRGGVGTYCHTEAVHVDVGPERDWNWRCRRRGGGGGEG